MKRYGNMAAIREANKAIDHHFFDRETMRFFNSRICGGPYGGRYFVTSEYYRERADRRYTIRIVMDDGSIDTVGGADGFGHFATRQGAETEARELASILGGDAEPCLRTFAVVRPGWPSAGVTHHYAYSGTVPNTGPRACTLCGRREPD